MVADGSYVGVVDRFETDAAGTELAVVLLESGDTQVGELVVDSAVLPAAASTDTVLDVVVEDGRLVDATVDEAATDRRSGSAQDRFDRLASRPPENESEGKTGTGTETESEGGDPEG